MKKFLLIVFALFLCVPAFADEAIFLKQDEVVRLKVPKSEINFDRIQDEDDVELYIPKRKNKDYHDEKETLFESRAGKAFNKFVDDWVIDNKMSRFTDRIVE